VNENEMNFLTNPPEGM